MDSKEQVANGSKGSALSFDNTIFKYQGRIGFGIWEYNVPRHWNEHVQWVISQGVH